MFDVKIEAANELMSIMAKRSNECTEEMKSISERLDAISSNEELSDCMLAERAALFERAKTLKDIMDLYDEVVTTINNNVMKGDIPEIMKLMLRNLGELVK